MTHPATTEPATPHTRQQPTRVWRKLLAALVGAVAIAMLVLWMQPPPPRFELITSNDYEQRTKRLAFIRDARAWMTRFSVKIFGFTPVHISAAYTVTGHGAADFTELPQPAFSTNAVRVWILGSNEVARVERDLRNDDTTRWRVTSSEGIPSSMSMGSPTGTGPGSVQFANHPKIRTGHVDVAAKFTSVVADAKDGQAAVNSTNQIAFRMLLKRDEGGILSDGTGVLFIWAHASP